MFPHIRYSVLMLLSLVACQAGDFSQNAEVGGDSLSADAAVPEPTMPDAGIHPIGPLTEGLSTLAGHSVSGIVDGDRDLSLFNNPVNVLVGPDENIYVADFDGNAIRVITPSGMTTTLVSQAGFTRPFGMVFTNSGDFYVQTDRNSLDMDTGALWHIALDTGTATLALDDSGRLRAMAPLSDGRIIVGDALNHTIEIFDPEGITLTPLAGEDGVPGYVDGQGSDARFNRPTDIAITANDQIMVSDIDNNRVRQITLAGEVTTVAGNGEEATVDGDALEGSLSRPSGLAINGETLYISSFGGGVVRQLSDGMLTTVAGSAPGFADHLDPLAGQLFGCEGIDYVSPYLYIADGSGGEDGPFNRVRRLTIP